MTERWAVGDELPVVTRRMTAERMRWYCDGLETVLDASGAPTLAGVNIHTDDGAANAAGLPGRIADGMISTNWISSLLWATFGNRYLSGGALSTKYIRPIFEDELIHVRAVIREIDDVDGVSPVALLDVWCESDDGVRCTVGEARARLTSDDHDPSAR